MLNYNFYYNIRYWTYMSGLYSYLMNETWVKNIKNIKIINYGQRNRNQSVARDNQMAANWAQKVSETQERMWIQRRTRRYDHLVKTRAQKMGSIVLQKQKKPRIIGFFFTKEETRTTFIFYGRVVATNN